MKFIVTGGAGFLGSHLCDRFIKEGYYVIGMDNFITGDKKNTSHLSNNPNFEFIEHDVTEFIKIEGELDYILHFASPASPIDYLKIPIQTLKVGSLGTHNLLGLAKAKKSRLLIMAGYYCSINLINGITKARASRYIWRRGSKRAASRVVLWF